MCVIENSDIQKRTVIKENNLCFLSCMEPSFKTFYVYIILTEIYRMLQYRFIVGENMVLVNNRHLHD